MNTNVTVTNKIFSMTDISQKEGMILRTLLNHSDGGIRDMLHEDLNYWGDDLMEDEAVKIGMDLRDKIMEMVDGED